MAMAMAISMELPMAPMDLLTVVTVRASIVVGDSSD
jgi:hypothetical protein